MTRVPFFAKGGQQFGFKSEVKKVLFRPSLEMS